MPSFGRLAAAAAVAGLASGVLLTLLQQVEIVPLIRAAEAFEAGARDEPPMLWATLAANIVLASGFALLLCAAMAARGHAGWRRGVLWGAAGFAVFFAAPSFGLPPELPGSEHAALGDRQAWWIATAAATAAGLALLCFAKQSIARVGAIALIALPHLIGAPEHALHASTLPAHLSRDFLRATFLVNAPFWLVLGALGGRLLPH